MLDNEYVVSSAGVIYPSARCIIAQQFDSHQTRSRIAEWVVVHVACSRRKRTQGPIHQSLPFVSVSTHILFLATRSRALVPKGRDEPTRSIPLGGQTTVEAIEIDVQLVPRLLQRLPLPHSVPKHLLPARNLSPRQRASI